ncbi:MAG: helix-turn-helix domain containing protein [Propionibacteriales bacterium]|nr:helix-turn-helix domain containing protein [Propionibacteriales bacterium]
MGRPPGTDSEALLDHARSLWVTEGVAAVTIRALSQHSGVSNGSIYHRFESRNHLLAEIWAREATAFRAYQRDQIEDARTHGCPQDAVFAAALVSGSYAEVEPSTARVLLASRPDVLDDTALPGPVAQQLREHRADAARLITELADAVWDRTDRTALILMRHCVVGIPARLFLTARTPNDPLARYAIEHAVRGILTAGPA